jgi:futalosine hydrolase
MILVVTATKQEMEPIAKHLAEVPGWLPFVAGIGCLETAVNLTRFLAATDCRIQGIINCGVAGAFVGAGPQMLDLCLAENEIQADIGIWAASGIIPFDTIQVPNRFPLDIPLREKAQAILQAEGVQPFVGPFVSLSTVSGILSRGESLRVQYQAICENMEGAAVARVSQDFHLPCLELRSISNMVVDRDPSLWQLAAAIQRAAQALAILLRGLVITL